MAFAVTIREDDLSGEAVRALLAFHLAEMQRYSPPENVHALDLSGLRGPDIVVFTAWAGADIAGIVALRLIGDGGGEVKSMRTHPDRLRRGAAGTLLDHIVAVARERGLRRLSLETGSGPAFDPALSLYTARGFVEGAPFGDYRARGFNRFLHRVL